MKKNTIIFYIISAIIILTGILSAISLFDTFGATSSEYGSPYTIEKIQDINLVSSFDFGIIQFTTKNEQEGVAYTYSQSFAPVEFNGNENDYVLFFNSQPLNKIQVKSGAISGELEINYYNIEGEKDCTSLLKVYISFFEGSTKIDMTLNNENDSISYFSTYMNYNGANLKLYIKGENDER